MTALAELLVNGLASGAVYALVALGFVIVHRSTEVINFAHPSLLLAGGYLVAVLHDDIGFWPALGAGVAGAAALGALVEFVVLRRLRSGSHGTLSIVTIGVDIVLTVEIARRIGAEVLPLGDPWGDRVVQVGGVTIAQARIAALGVAVAAITVFLLAFKYTSWGVAMRAAAEDRATAALMGVRLGRVSAGAWAVAGALAALAALFLCVFPTPGLDRATSFAALKALPAAVIGGVDSTTGALAGGLLIGVTEALAVGYQDEAALLRGGFADIAPYLLMIVVLLIRPTGLFGTRELARA
ncbi:branched-chain amino acid ABC transporter permease [Bailinhaonella thermotolerans]|uniref:Branched-chain amino acid ABC transporter permease n=1 Tax=Bailinhaonella thermotolerans TaxID=1070861 RepID=A0A3A4B051_9ACTN|nr:branched-chain amino acid ABC transporter permease [Bailinhaonella thermotolerans]RJL36027.1 branched-chain amino acid ABC transporter permease [Bailinhaonella thermotolerans]